jgi:hypothetical protein
MTKAEKIEQLELEQDMDDCGYDDYEQGVNGVGLTDEHDYYPEDEFEMDQRNAEFQMIDPLGDDSDI